MTQPALIAEAMPVIEFSVAGKPVPQGSKIGLVSGKRVKDGRDVWVRNPMVSMVDQADRKTTTQPAGRLKRWKALIEAKADYVARGSLLGPVRLWQGPVQLECEFVLPRSPSHFTKKGNLTKSAPRVPVGDLDKLIRAVGDALSKVVYRDDVQVVSFGNSTKRFARGLADAKGRPFIGGVRIKVTQIEGLR